MRGNLGQPPNFLAETFTLFKSFKGLKVPYKDFKKSCQAEIILVMKIKRRCDFECNLVLLTIITLMGKQAEILFNTQL